MTEEEIAELRVLVEQSKNVCWVDGLGNFRKVSDIPVTEMDPDRTGVPDFIARLSRGGHIDLSNVDISDFVTVSIKRLSSTLVPIQYQEGQHND